jgi:hypothetical protein
MPRSVNNLETQIADFKQIAILEQSAWLRRLDRRKTKACCLTRCLLKQGNIVTVHTELDPGFFQNGAVAPHVIKMSMGIYQHFGLKPLLLYHPEDLIRLVSWINDKRLLRAWACHYITINL